MKEKTKTKIIKDLNKFINYIEKFDIKRTTYKSHASFIKTMLICNINEWINDVKEQKEEDLKIGIERAEKLKIMFDKEDVDFIMNEMPDKLSKN